MDTLVHDIEVWNLAEALLICLFVFFVFFLFSGEGTILICQFLFAPLIRKLCVTDFLNIQEVQTLAEIIADVLIHKCLDTLITEVTNTTVAETILD